LQTQEKEVGVWLTQMDFKSQLCLLVAQTSMSALITLANKSKKATIEIILKLRKKKIKD